MCTHTHTHTPPSHTSWTLLLNLLWFFGECGEVPATGEWDKDQEEGRSPGLILTGIVWLPWSAWIAA